MFNSVIGTRYKSPLLDKIWSHETKIIEMRKLWISLAENQLKLGVESINDIGINEMKNNIDNIDFDLIEKYESKYKHDVMAYNMAFCIICPNAKKFIHLGATSNFINDNIDIIIIKKSLFIIQDLLKNIFNELKNLSFKYIDIPTIAYTHLQNGQLTTIGKRFTMWNSDIYLDLINLERIIVELPFRGIKGTVGTEDSILKIFNGDSNKCKELNKLIANDFGFDNSIIICGQTYSRKYDVMIFHLLSGIAQSIYKMMNDLRLLSSKKEIYEDFNIEQIGSSAMPYKINPISCEKICSLARYIINNENNITNTYINQWLERTLDDSAIKRIIYPESFLLLEHILTETYKTLNKLYINTDYIKTNIDNYMPYILSENIIINGVSMGYERNYIHEKLKYIMKKINNNLTMNDLLKDDVINKIITNCNISILPNDYIGRCVEQINEFYNK